MQKDHIFRVLKQHWQFVTICVLFSIVTILLACTYFKHYMSPDTTSYFTIAAKYARFDFGDALNGYWGPLLSWLLVPTFWLHADPIITSKIIGTGIGLTTLILLYGYLYRQRVQTAVRIATSCIAALFLTQWITVGPITPDLLLAFFVLAFVITLEQFLGKPTFKRGVLLGAIGAGMYFSKGFGFYLFLAIIALITCWQLWKQRWAFGQVVRRFAPIYITFFVLILPFIGLLTIKYHHLTINTAGAYNQHTMGPVAKGQQPMLYTGPLAPPNDSAISVWENPALTIPIVPNWSPLESHEYFSYFINSILGRNLNYSLKYIAEFGPAIMLGVLSLYVGSVRKAREQRFFAIASIVCTVTILGYAVVLTEPRYLLGVALLGITGGALWLSRCSAAHVLKSREILVATVLVAGIALLGVSQQVVAFHKVDERNWLYAHQRVETLRPLLPKGSKAMSDTFSTYYTCYYLDLRCYGVLETPAPGAEDAYIKRVREAGVTYFFDYHTRPDMAFKTFIDSYFTKIGETRVGDKNEILTTVYKLR